TSSRYCWRRTKCKSSPFWPPTCGRAPTSWTRSWPPPWAAATVTRPNIESRETFMRVKGKPASRRQSLLIIATLVFVVLGLIYATWWWLHASHFEDTDNAYVQGNLVQVTAQIPGTVVAIE